MVHLPPNEGRQIMLHPACTMTSRTRSRCQDASQAKQSYCPCSACGRDRVQTRRCETLCCRLNIREHWSNNNGRFGAREQQVLGRRRVVDGNRVIAARNPYHES